MKNVITSTILLLAILWPLTATAYDFVVDGIGYDINGNEATVTTKRNPGLPYFGYSGSVVIPATVTYNGTTYPVTEIGIYAFYGCSELTSIDIPNSVTKIAQEAFGNCDGLTSIVVESGNPRYDSRNNCNAIIETANNVLIVGCKNTIIPNSVTKIGNLAFDCCYSLTSIVIPNSVTSIGHHAFYGCTGLTSIDIPNSVTKIGEHAFAWCTGLTSIDISNSVTEIGNYAFYDCKGLTSIVVESGNPKYDSRNNCNAIIETADNTLIVGCKNTIIPNSVTVIGQGAFHGCTGLTSIDIPNSVTAIGNEAFYGCEGLTSIDIPNSVTSIGHYAFYDCKGLTSIVIPNSVTSIGNYAFYDCIGLTSIVIPNSVTAIGSYAFYGCEGLTSIDIPNSVTEIGIYAFAWCSGLTSIVIPNSVTEIGLGAFYHTAWFNNQPDGLVYVGLVAYKYKGTMPSGTSITLKEGTIGISGEAFYRCAGLTGIVIPNSVASIGRETFYGCTGLTSIDIPSSVTSIGYGAFAGCTGLTDVYCYIADPSRVLSGNYQFYLDGGDYSGRTLHVLRGTASLYRTNWNWYLCFEQIVEDLFRGDVNADREVNIADVNAVISMIMVENGSTSFADVNGDGEINIADINTLIDTILSDNNQ